MGWSSIFYPGSKAIDPELWEEFSRFRNFLGFLGLNLGWVMVEDCMMGRGG